MRGWIYVISNKSMPGLVKVGYSSKDPDERAKELDHTGTPHPYVVEYDILIEGELYQVEQRIHQNLSSYSEGKEWFRCTPEQAVIAIRQVAKEIAIAESFKKADREKAERLERERKLEITREQEKREREAKLIEKEREIKQKYEDLLKDKFPSLGVKYFLKLWLVFSVLISFLWFFLFEFNSPKMTIYFGFGAAAFWGILGGFLVAKGWTERKKNKQKISAEYRSLIDKWNAELERIRNLG